MFFKKRIIIDADMGADDYMAIQLALLSKKIVLEGVSLVFGNTSMKNAKNNVFKTFEMIGMQNATPVYCGFEKPLHDFGVSTVDNAFGENGFGNVKYKKVCGKVEKQNAVDFLIEKVNKNPKKITVVAIGPLTNIASAILSDKNFVKNVKEIVIMGGAENFGNITPFAEFNFYNDPVSAQIVFDAGFRKIKMIGFNITKLVTINKPLEETLKNSSDKNAKFIFDITRETAKLDKQKNGTDGASINDPLNICYLIDKKSVKFKKANVSIETKNLKRLGESKVDYKKTSNCQIACSVDVEKCRKIVFNNILKTKIF